MDLQGMRGLYALLTSLQSRSANALVAFSEAAMQKGHSQLMLTFASFEADLLQPSVNFFDCRIQSLIDRFVVGFAADIRAVKLFAVEQHNHRVFEFHPRHFSRE